MKQKIIFLDIDGTLTEPGKNKPPQSAQRAVELAREQGHLVFLCTGRNYGMLSPLLKYGFDGIIASSGGYIECGEKVIYDCPMTEQQKQMAMSCLKENGIYRTVECMNGAYTDEGFKEFLRNHAGEGSNSELLRWREQIEKELNIRPMAEYQGQPVYKIVMMSPSWERLMKVQKRLSDEFQLCIQQSDRQGFVNGELLNKQFDKGKAVVRACEYLQIPLVDSVAVGDSMNDREMLKVAGLSICMGNGSEALKALADDVCPSVMEDGLYCAFEQHGLI